jgi:ABC-type multidrug transport system ATPase subunit
MKIKKLKIKNYGSITSVEINIDSQLVVIKELNKEHGITVILITHYMEEAVEADRILVMDEGRLLLEGNPKEIFSNVEQMKNMGLDVPQITELSYRVCLIVHRTGQ